MTGSITEIFDKMEFKIYEYHNEVLNSMMILKNYYQKMDLKCDICFNKYSEQIIFQHTVILFFI